ncbi:dolichyl-phosphate-mannose--protein mannosyltransferase, partial [Synechococcus sp. R60.3]
MRPFGNPNRLGSSPSRRSLPGSSSFVQFRRDPHLVPFWGLSLLVMGLAVPLFVLSGADPSLAGCDESF